MHVNSRASEEYPKILTKEPCPGMREIGYPSEATISPPIGLDVDVAATAKRRWRSWTERYRSCSETSHRPFQPQATHAGNGPLGCLVSRVA